MILLLYLNHYFYYLLEVNYYFYLYFVVWQKITNISYNFIIESKLSFIIIIIIDCKYLNIIFKINKSLFLNKCIRSTSLFLF